jgi:peptidyl-prolyl cis-trans isomerase C
MKTMTYGRLFVIFLMLFLIPLTGWAQEQPAPDDTAAVVNGVVITKKALTFETQRFVEQMARQGQVPNEEMMPEVRENVLNRMIEEELLYQDSQAKTIKVPEERVEKELASIKERFPSEKEYQDALAGIEMTEDALALKITRGVAIEELIKRHVIPEIAVSEEESRAFYDQNTSMFEKPEQVQARHILIKTTEEATEDQKKEARKKIDDIRKKVVAGEDFADLAKTYSEGPSNVRGGDLGYFSRGQMVKPFEDVAFSLKKGEISEVVETQFGYHIIEVTDHQPASVVAYETAQAQIEERLKQEKSLRQIRQYIETLRENADIQIPS